MRVLYVTATYLPTVNGVSFQIELFKKELARAGHQIYILAPKYPGYKDLDQTIIRYPSLPNPLIRTYPIGLPILPIDKIASLQPEVIHAHHPLLIGWFARLLSQKLSLPLFFTAHTHYLQYLHSYLPLGYQITSRLLIRDLQNLSHRCHTVVCPSNRTQCRLQELSIINTKVIPNGIETDLFKPSQSKAHHPPTVVFTGRLEKEKNPQFLLSVADCLSKNLKEFRFLIIGDGSLLPKMIHPHIQCLGETPRSSLPQIYHSADLFITPSTSEIMPLSVIEAISSGLPVIGLQDSHLEELVIDGQTGLLLPPNPNFIAAKISYLFHHQQLLQKMSTAARKHALEFSIQSATRQLVNLYQAALKEKRISLSQN